MGEWKLRLMTTVGVQTLTMILQSLLQGAKEPIPFITIYGLQRHQAAKQSLLFFTNPSPSLTVAKLYLYVICVNLFNGMISYDNICISWQKRL